MWYVLVIVVVISTWVLKEHVSSALFGAVDMDWTQCVICQQATSEPLRCPLKAGKPGHKSEAYSSFLPNVTQFRELDQLPVPLNFGEDVDMELFMTNQAKWHTSCHLKFCVDKLQRARKRKRNDTSTVITSEMKRLRHREPFNK